MQNSFSVCPEGHRNLWDSVSGSNGSGTFIQQVINLLFDSQRMSHINDSSSVIEFKQPAELDVSYLSPRRAQVKSSLPLTGSSRLSPGRRWYKSQAADAVRAACYKIQRENE